MTVWLIGMMGSGKSAVGKQLAKCLHLDWIDMDAYIEEKAGKTIPDIFTQDGELAFRQWEARVIHELASKSAVISTGGGAPLRPVNVETMQRSGKVVYLKASVQHLLGNLRGEMGHRPLLQVDDPETTLQELLDQRKSYYEEAANMTVTVSGRTLEAIARDISEQL